MKVLTDALYSFYKFWVSPLLGCNCRYHPTCSAYARQAVHKHGFFRGAWLTAWRILNCHPWSRRPHQDPVP